MNRYRCRICGFLYEEKRGIPERGIAAGAAWETLPASWCCPACGAGKENFAQEKEPDGLPKATYAFPASGSGPQKGEKSETQPDAFSFEERSTIFSNLAKGCEKQHAMKEAECFYELSAYFQKREDAKPAGELRQLAEAMRVDLTENYPDALAAAAVKYDRGALRALVWGEKVTRGLISILKKYTEGKEALFQNADLYICQVCGYVFVGEKAPEICPVCKAPPVKIKKLLRG